MADLENLEAWAITQGYDPAVNYATPPETGEPDEPEEVLPPPPPSLQPGYLSPNFKASEFACRHCGKLPDNGMDPKLIETLQRIRDYVGVPVTINSGYRCATHNANVGGASNSQHLLGTAADFTVRGMAPSEVYNKLDPLWPGGLGRYNTFTHIDTRPTRARWTG